MRRVAVPPRSVPCTRLAPKHCIMALQSKTPRPARIGVPALCKVIAATASADAPAVVTSLVTSRSGGPSGSDGGGPSRHASSAARGGSDDDACASRAGAPARPERPSSTGWRASCRPRMPQARRRPTSTSAARRAHTMPSRHRRQQVSRRASYGEVLLMRASGTSWLRPARASSSCRVDGGKPVSMLPTPRCRKFLHGSGSRLPTEEPAIDEWLMNVPPAATAVGCRFGALRLTAA